MAKRPFTFNAMRGTLVAAAASVVLGGVLVVSQLGGSGRPEPVDTAGIDEQHPETIGETVPALLESAPVCPGDDDFPFQLPDPDKGDPVEPTPEMINRQLEMSLYVPQLKAHFGTRWGGVRIDHDQGSMIFIDVVTPTDADTTAAAQIVPNGTPFEIREAFRSLEELERQAVAYLDIVETLEQEGFNLGLAAISGSPPRFHVSLNPDDDSPEAEQLDALGSRILELDPSLDALCLSAADTEWKLSSGPG